MDDEVGMSSSKIPKTGTRRNRWTPLQLLDNDDDNSITDMDSEQPQSGQNNKISPIKVLTKNSDIIINLLNDRKIDDFLVKKISIGLKILCNTITTYNKVIAVLQEKNYQYFTHDHKNNKPFKVVIHRLDNKTSTEVKNELISLGLKCIDVKEVKRTYEKYVDTLYIVHLERGSVKLHELRKNIRSLFKIIITWDYQRRIKNKTVQCRKCQMHGHGEKGCHVAILCSNCAGNHLTSECQTPNKIKCANCGKNHKSTDASCPNRIMYLEMKQKLTLKTHHSKRKSIEFNTNNENFPPLCKSANKPVVVNNWKHVNNSDASSHNQFPVAAGSTLFSEQEFLQLTSEMISKLGSCTTREQQFNVVAELAFKFVYNNSHK